MFRGVVVVTVFHPQIQILQLTKRREFIFDWLHLGLYRVAPPCQSWVTGLFHSLTTSGYITTKSKKPSNLILLYVHSHSVMSDSLQPHGL